MDCQDVQPLLPFVDHRQELDPPEQEAIREHLEKCSDCAARAKAEAAADEVLGGAMRDVPVPPLLKTQILSRLSADRRSAMWKSMRSAGLASAAALALLLLAGGTWYLWPKPDVTVPEAQSLSQQGVNWDNAHVKEFFDARRLHVKIPDQFNEQYLRHVEVTEFLNRRVAKLSYQRDDDQPCRADVLILPHRDFRVDKLPSEEFPGFTRLWIFHDGEFTYLIYYVGDSISPLLKRLN